jgi:predicted ribosome quality control (RQC) complex YloA/Tae2 family protein
VVLRRQEGQPSEAAIEAAAQLAAYFSEGREDSRVDVDITEVKHVRKISGGALGRVTYRNHRNLSVQPTIAGWVRK